MRKQPQYLNVISDDEVELIHRNSVRILEEVGVRFPDDEMLARFEQAGCVVDHDTQIVKIPEALVNRALVELPKDFSSAPADGGPPIRLGDGRLQLSMDTTPDIVDVMTGRKRRGTDRDVMQGIAVSNALASVRLACAYCLPENIAQAAADVWCYELLWTYSQKPVATWIYSTQSARRILEMATIVAGGEDELRAGKTLTYFAEPISPLQYAPHTLEIVQLFARYGLPIYLGPMVTMGGSGPVTLAGTLSLHHAEMLHGLVMTYLCNPKQPVIYSCHCHSVDLMHMVTQYGAPEQALLAVGATQLAKRLGLAVCGNVMLTDSNCLDYMAGFQEGATAAWALAAGWDMLGFMGFGTIGVVGNGVGHSLEKVIVQDEALSYLQRMVRSFDVNEETLAFAAIREAGIGGNFAAAEHTVRHMRGEVWRGSGLFRGEDYAQWSAGRSEEIRDRAHARLEQILEDALPLEPALPTDKVNALQEITRQAQAEATP